jgi:UDP:flavonoid glycosyltransferase YjiC (YdhE family)
MASWGNSMGLVKMRRVLFSGDGSSGDLLPMVLMAREFMLAGYDVCVCGSSEYAQMARDFAVPFEPYPHSYSRLYLEKQRTGYIHSMRENIRHQVSLFQGEYELLSEIAPQFDVLINFLGELFVPSIAEAFRLPNIKLFTFPLVRSERYAPPTGVPFITESKWLNGLHWDAATLAARYLFSYNATINRLRSKLNLPPVKDLLANNARFDHLMIGLYEELLPPCESWKGFDYTYVGPCLPKTQVPLSEDLEAFLTQGSRPIYIGFGSMHHANGKDLTRILLDAARDAGTRVILAQNASTIGSGLRGSENVFVLRDYPIPHHVLFPRLKAAVHHGSWIATHLAAQAGIPQLVLPQASDQYLWASVVWKNGLGPKGVDMNRMKPEKLSAAIEQLTQRREYESNAQALAARVNGIDGARNAVRLFERLQAGLSASSRVAHDDSPSSGRGGRRRERAALAADHLGRPAEMASQAEAKKVDMESLLDRSVGSRGTEASAKATRGLLGNTTWKRILSLAAQHIAIDGFMGSGAAGQSAHRDSEPLRDRARLWRPQMHGRSRRGAGGRTSGGDRGRRRDGG